MKGVKKMDNSKITIQGVNFDKIGEYINIKEIKKEYKSDKRLCWFTALKDYSLGIIVFLLIVVGIVLTMMEYQPTSLAEGYWRILAMLGFVGLVGFIVIGGFITSVQNYGSDWNTNCGFDYYFEENYELKYCLSKSNISTGTFFIKKNGVKSECLDEPYYDFCYQNNKYECNEEIKVIIDDTVKTPRFDILEMTLYIPKGYKMPTREEVLYVNIDKVREK